MTILLSAVLPVALVAFAGSIVGRCFDLNLTTLSRLSLYLLFPALVLTGLRDSSLGLEQALGMVAGVWLTSALLYGLAVTVGHRLGYSSTERKTLVATTMFSNTGNMGLPFVLFSLGEAGLERAIVHMIASALMVATVGPTVLKGEGLRRGLGLSLRLPIFWATLAGLGLQAFALELPLALNRSLTMLGQAAVPLALLTLGIQLSQTQFSLGRDELLAAGMRLVMSPLVAHGVGRLLGLDGLELRVLTIQAAMPVAVNSLIWVTEMGGDRRRVARAILTSTLLSLGTLPLLLWLVQRGVS